MMSSSNKNGTDAMHHHKANDDNGNLIEESNVDDVNQEQHNHDLEKYSQNDEDEKMFSEDDKFCIVVFVDFSAIFSNSAKYIIFDKYKK